VSFEPAPSPASSAAATPVRRSKSADGRAGIDTPGSRESGYPVQHILEAAIGGRSRSRGWTRARLWAKVHRDPQLLLAVAIAVPVVAVEGTSGDLQRTLGILGPVTFVLIQLVLTTLRSAPDWLPTLRLAGSLAFVVLMNLLVEPSGHWPLTALIVPVVAMAAAHGRRADVAVVVAAILLIVAPAMLPTSSPGLRQELLAVTMAAIVTAIGSRRVVASLERSADRLRRAQARDRRHSRQLGAMESVGRVLAVEGPTETALDQVIGVLEQTFGYRYPSVYLWDGQLLQLGAQRNYRFPIQTITPDRGILGRIVRSKRPAYLPDARRDPVFLSADPEVMSEIGVPLLSDGELLGVLNVETSGDHRLDEDDLAMMVIVGDRLSAALALGRERQTLTERTALLDRLTTFATALSASLDPDTIHGQVAAGVARVIAADMVVLVERDERSEEYRIVATAGGDAGVVGSRVRPGEGVSGRAISTATLIVDPHLARANYPRAAAAVDLADVVVGMAAPMVTDGQVIGALTWLREDLDHTFTVQEQEVAVLMAGKVALAVANASLHQKTRDAAITDALTGLHNRRHFDAALVHEDAVRLRVPAEHRRARSAIMFDLDHFGAVNKQYGHLVGDRVLRLFADLLRARIRTADLLSRFGGEEFVVILDGASREDAIVIAEAIRTAFGRATIDLPGGERLTCTVSAGCSTLEPWEVEGTLLLERADVALAMAKAGGRDQVVAA
jgi:diguanylate cyclase (GGDEF)-like protein